MNGMARIEYRLMLLMALAFILLASGIWMYSGGEITQYCIMAVLGVPAIIAACLLDARREYLTPAREWDSSFFFFKYKVRSTCKWFFFYSLLSSLGGLAAIGVELYKVYTGVNASLAFEPVAIGTASIAMGMLSIALKNKWAFIVLTLLNGNILTYIINGVYLKNRWSEMDKFFDIWWLGSRSPNEERISTNYVSSQGKANNMNSSTAQNSTTKERSWFYINQDGEQTGPIAESIFLGLFRSGKLSPETKVWTKDMGQRWAKAMNIENLIPEELMPPPVE